MGSPIGFQYHASTYASGVFDVYWYEKNLQGDIVAVYDQAGNMIVKYRYDAWGNCYTTNVASSVPTAVTNNPFRYRGYYYDNDLGLYYLNSRYYDANTGRFISADSFVNGNGDILGYNMFAYCSNNPVMYADPSGNSATVVTVVIIAVAVNTLTSFFSAVALELADYYIYSEEFKWRDIGISTGIGAVEGALVALFPSAAMYIGAGASILDTVISGIHDKDQASKIAIDALISGFIGLVAGAGGNNFAKQFDLIADAASSLGNAYRKGVHPIVKKGAKKIIKKAVGTIEEMFSETLIDELIYGEIDKFTSWLAEEILGSFWGE